jgi:hypothetical protein
MVNGLSSSNFLTLIISFSFISISFVYLVRHCPRANVEVKIVFPNAPIKLSTESYAWWNIDLQKYVGLASTGLQGMEKIATDSPDGILDY